MQPKTPFDFDPNPVRSWHAYWSIATQLSPQPRNDLPRLERRYDQNDPYRTHPIQSIVEDCYSGYLYRADVQIDKNLAVRKAATWNGEPVLAVMGVQSRYRWPVMLVRHDGAFMFIRGDNRFQIENALCHWTFLARCYVVRGVTGWVIDPSTSAYINLKRGATDIPYFEATAVSSIWLRLVPGSDSPHEHEHVSKWMVAATHELPHQYRITPELATRSVEVSYDRARARRRRAFGIRKEKPVIINSTDGKLSNSDAAEHFAQRLVVVTNPTSRAHIRTKVTRLTEANTT